MMPILLMTGLEYTNFFDLKTHASLLNKLSRQRSSGKQIALTQAFGRYQTLDLIGAQSKWIQLFDNPPDQLIVKVDAA